MGGGVGLDVAAYFGYDVTHEFIGTDFRIMVGPAVGGNVGVGDGVIVHTTTTPITIILIDSSLWSKANKASSSRAFDTWALSVS